MLTPVELAEYKRIFNKLIESDGQIDHEKIRLRDRIKELEKERNEMVNDIHEKNRLRDRIKELEKERTEMVDDIHDLRDHYDETVKRYAALEHDKLKYVQTLIDEGKVIVEFNNKAVTIKYSETS